LGSGYRPEDSDPTKKSYGSGTLTHQKILLYILDEIYFLGGNSLFWGKNIPGEVLLVLEKF
jgi:hypothetical protein